MTTNQQHARRLALKSSRFTHTEVPELLGAALSHPSFSEHSRYPDDNRSAITQTLTFK